MTKLVEDIGGLTSLVKENDPILKKVAEKFDFENPIVDPEELSESLQFLRAAGGAIGLAANQIGLSTRVMCIGMGNFSTEGTEEYQQTFFNPDILHYEGDEVYMIEGCLSFPGLAVEVKRPTTIFMKWEDEKGNPFNEKFEGITSRIIQHEYDHLMGITMDKKANRFHLERAKKKRRLLAKAQTPRRIQSAK